MKTNTFHNPRLKLCAMLMVLSVLIACQPPKTQVSEASPELPKASNATSPVYPLKVSANHRYLVDQNNTPFLIVGDTPQGLIYRLSEKEADGYFADRQAHGFNTMGWIDVACAGRDYPSNTHAETPDGLRPFAMLPGGNDYTHSDLSKPDEAYFTRLDHIVESAARHGIFVFIDPVETAGWLPPLRNNGLKVAYGYGQYLGNRYKKFSNVAWLNGNDFMGWQKATDDALVQAVAKGIKSVDPDQIQTVEFNPPPFGSSLDDPAWAALIAINGAYVYGPTYIQVLRNYNQTPIMPVFLIEAHYELEDVGTPPDFGTPNVLRREEYWAMLTGAKGQFYGNMYTWSFKPGWQNNIDTPGVAQVTIWKDFFTGLPWQDLVPDQDHSVLTAGFGTFGDLKQTRVSKSDYATASKTPDGGFVVVYMPTTRTITVNMASLKGSANARWFDPTNGTYTSIAGQSFPNHGTKQFTPPGNNHAGDGDWVLVLDASK
jgi:Protein of unknown function (DUF4038)/Putative collagen-binding domain of a collagenase